MNPRKNKITLAACKVDVFDSETRSFVMKFPTFAISCMPIIPSDWFHYYLTDKTAMHYSGNPDNVVVQFAK